MEPAHATDPGEAAVLDQGLRHALPDVSDVPHPRDGGDLSTWAQAVSERHGSLTPDEVTAIYHYTTDEGYREMNGLLRGTVDYSPADTARIKTDIDNSISGLKKLPTVTGRTFRGTTLPPDALDKVRVGERYPDRSFQSSSTELPVAEGFRADGNAIVHIDGWSGVDVSGLSEYGHEAEVLFSPEADLVVTDLEPSEDGTYWNIYLKER